ncbi:uncharacterized protein METZ01_LOCUS347850, partial [marine metagenome]
VVSGGHGRTRTCYLLIRNQALYPDELRIRKIFLFPLFPPFKFRMFLSFKFQQTEMFTKYSLTFYKQYINRVFRINPQVRNQV